MLTIEQFRQLWQLLAALYCDYDVLSVTKSEIASSVDVLMDFCKKIMEDN